MRNVVIIDKLIDKDEALAILKDWSDFYKKHTGIEVTYWLERWDFTEVPTYVQKDGDMKPTYEYRQAIADDIHSRYSTYGTDNIIMWVHEDNFLYKGVWGTAWSYVHREYNFLLCRWDKHNKTNTWNTLFHEGEHPADTLIKKELGIDINPLIANHFGYDSFDYDSDYVHGNHPDWKYIGRRGYKRDGRMLKFLAPYLAAAYQARKEKYEEHTNGLRKTIVKLLTEKVYWLRRLITRNK